MYFLNRCGALCTVGALIWCVSVYAEEHVALALPDDDYQMRRLMAPTPSELASERKGRVHIYDSLSIEEIDAALDVNFDRIQHMMFTRIHHPPASGSGPAEVEDDGCD